MVFIINVPFLIRVKYKGIVLLNEDLNTYQILKFYFHVYDPLICFIISTLHKEVVLHWKQIWEGTDHGVEDMVRWLKAFAGFAGNPCLISYTCKFLMQIVVPVLGNQWSLLVFKSMSHVHGTHIYVHTGNTHTHKFKIIYIYIKRELNTNTRQAGLSLFLLITTI